MFRLFQDINKGRGMIPVNGSERRHRVYGSEREQTYSRGSQSWGEGEKTREKIRKRKGERGKEHPEKKKTETKLKG